MNIQIFGANKCFDTKKAERWFKERRIKYQSIDLVRYGMSGGEFDSVLRAVGGIDRLIDWDKKAPEIDLMRYMAVSYTHLRAHETGRNLVCRLLLEKKKTQKKENKKKTKKINKKYNSGIERKQ